MNICIEFGGRLAAIARRSSPVRIGCREDQSLRHLAEMLGLPACELGGATIGGQSWPLELPPIPGAVVLLLPIAEPVLLDSPAAFLCDGHLGRLCRLLRLLGLDVETRGRDLSGADPLGDFASSDEAFVETAMAEERIILTRDRALLFRRELADRELDEAWAEAPAQPARRAMLLASTDPLVQAAEVCRRFGLESELRPLSRCSACGARLEPASPEVAALGAPPKVLAACTDFRRCPRCGKLFWRGDHSRSIEPLLARLGDAMGDIGPAL